jgi:hypothetical protein
LTGKRSHFHYLMAPRKSQSLRPRVAVINLF